MHSHVQKNVLNLAIPACSEKSVYQGLHRNGFMADGLQGLGKIKAGPQD